MDCLLAPVPVCHLPDALDLARGGETVAFGTNAFEMMARIRDAGLIGNLEVYIVASKTGFDPTDPNHRMFDIGKANLKGVLTGVTAADRRGRYPVDGVAVRPATTVADQRGDDAWAVFWEVSDLTLLTPALPIDAFLTAGGAPWKKTPEGPELAKIA